MLSSMGSYRRWDMVTDAERFEWSFVFKDFVTPEVEPAGYSGGARFRVVVAGGWCKLADAGRSGFEC